MRSYRLSYCSVDAELTFSAVMKSQKMTALSPQDLDKSSFKYLFGYLVIIFHFTPVLADKIDLKKKQQLNVSNRPV